MKILLGVLLMFSVVNAQTSSSARKGLLAVVFKVTLDINRKVTLCEVSKVIDPNKSEKPIPFSVSEKYKKIACDSQAGGTPQLKDGMPVPYFTYYLIDPKKPDEVIKE